MKRTISKRGKVATTKKAAPETFLTEHYQKEGLLDDCATSP